MSFCTVAVVCASVACTGFKNDSAGGGDGGAPGDGASGEGGSSSGGSSGSGSGCGSGSGSSSGSSSSSSGGSDGGTAMGAGPLGDLPSGYCCTSNADCRNRYCVDLGSGNKMCEDECDGAQSACNGLLSGFTCTWDDAMAYGFCEPPTATTACAPANQYVHGTKPTGACCSATGDATSGQECMGGNCGSSGTQTNPHICTNACGGAGGCPAEYTCSNLGVYNVCVPIADPYTCQ